MHQFTETQRFLLEGQDDEQSPFAADHLQREACGAVLCEDIEFFHGGSVTDESNGI